MVTPRIDGEKGTVPEVDVPEEDAPEVAVQKKLYQKQLVYLPC